MTIPMRHPYEYFGHYSAITKSDTVAIADGSTAAIYVGGAGDVVAVRDDGTTVTFVAVPAGTFLRIRAMRVNATNTSATNMIACYPFLGWK